jgi:hypothetical protein
VDEGDHASAIVMELDSAAHARAVVDAELTAVRGSLGASVFPLGGERAFSLPSLRGADSATRQCMGAWLVRGHLAAEVIICSLAPPSARTLERMVARQRELLDRG